jgi:NADH-quinone oxidoreductase subunit L
MEGPTPVSALIHAATMVTAGVYLVARTAAIFEISPIAMGAVAVIGAGTALWAATIALAQTDIKRVLAYSTISQLGYMFLAVGAAGYTAGIFHLMTHAFFKALLFLGAGSVIHGMAGEQDMRRMGGLRKHMPVTFVTMAVGTLAIAGMPPLSGFWSKDEILGVAFERGGFFVALWAVGLVTAFLTAFYMTRQFVLVFLGEPRWEGAAHPHESPRVMTLPLMLLAVLAIFGGFVNTPFRQGLESFLEPSFELVQQTNISSDPLVIAVLAILAVGAGLLGIGAAAFVYRRAPNEWDDFENGFGPAWGWWREGYRVDELYGTVVVAPGLKAAEVAAFKVDLPIIDGAVNSVGGVAREVGFSFRNFQTGFVRNYGAYFVAGIAALLLWLALRGG